MIFGNRIVNFENLLNLRKQIGIMSNKVVIFSAPSGSGKSTVVNHILGLHPEMEFSVSATSRAPRGTEQDGVEYYFLPVEEFRRLIGEDAFVEYERCMPAATTGL